MRGLSDDLQRQVWRTYFSDYVIPDLPKMCEMVQSKLPLCKLVTDRMDFERSCNLRPVTTMPKSKVVRSFNPVDRLKKDRLAYAIVRMKTDEKTI